ncbi:hypothetical protein M0D69_22505 [Caballeronia sp. SEWSISQ10-4 2]|uniref:hypothetical protein n=1 Tax=Caballeronia sp. SEWSISQ10-4 2 TaxID=2937438 RepID=UPI00264EC118|nr:hypothetical protein [Caballeronia sp. SEWSISQ10-4 2]MDN7180719.1 hypothetical protein [Caballeronia sp. SEWSISQ10-4 2]
MCIDWSVWLNWCRSREAQSGQFGTFDRQVWIVDNCRLLSKKAEPGYSTQGQILRLLRWLRRIIVIALSLVGMYGVMGFVLHKIKTTEEPKPDALQSFPSPDGRYRAELLTWAGGGGISPYCHQALLVVPASVDAGQASPASKYGVYSGECDDFADHGFSPKIAWMSSNALRVSFSINSTAALPATVRLRKIDATGTVRVEFDARE